jgi:hypothetical protein
MNDLDTRVRESLQEAGRAFAPGRARATSPERFTRARRRRMFLRSAGVVAVTAALIVTAVLVIPSERASDDSVPIGPAPIPEGPIEITTRIAVAPQPRGVVADDGVVYVGYSEETGVDVIDPKVDRLARHLDSLVPWPVITSGDGHLWIGGGTVRGVNLSTNEVLSERLVGSVSALSFGGGFVWAASEWQSKDGCCENSIVQMSPEDLSVLQRYPVEDTTMAAPVYPNIDYGYGALWVATNGGKADGLVRIDPETREMQTVPGIDSASDVAVGAGGVWVYENSSKALRSRLMRVDPETLEVEEKAVVLGYFAWLEADENGVWVLNASDETDRRLLRIDPATGDSMGTSLKLGAGPFEMSSGFGSIWITDEGKGELLRVDVQTDMGRSN